MGSVHILNRSVKPTLREPTVMDIWLSIGLAICAFQVWWMLIAWGHQE